MLFQLLADLEVRIEETRAKVAEQALIVERAGLQMAPFAIRLLKTLEGSLAAFEQAHANLLVLARRQLERASSQEAIEKLPS